MILLKDRVLRKSAHLEGWIVRFCGRLASSTSTQHTSNPNAGGHIAVQGRENAVQTRDLLADKYLYDDDTNMGQRIEGKCYCKSGAI